MHHVAAVRQAAAAKAEEELVRCACGIGAPGHLAGMPSLTWTDSTVPAPPMFLQNCNPHLLLLAPMMPGLLGSPVVPFCPLFGSRFLSFFNKLLCPNW